MDRHVQQQHVRHVVTEAAEMCADVEVTVYGGHPADGAGGQEAAQAANIGVEAAVLHHGVDLAGRLSNFDRLPSVRHGIGQWLLAQDVAAVAQRLQGDAQVRLRYSAVEDDVGARGRQHSLEVVGHDRVVPAVLLGSGPRGLLADVHEADHAYVSYAPDRVQPRPADAPASSQDCADFLCHSAILAESFDVNHPREEPCCSFARRSGGRVSGQPTRSRTIFVTNLNFSTVTPGGQLSLLASTYR